MFQSNDPDIVTDTGHADSTYRYKDKSLTPAPAKQRFSRGMRHLQRSSKPNVTARRADKDTE